MDSFSRLNRVMVKFQAHLQRGCELCPKGKIDACAMGLLLQERIQDCVISWASAIGPGKWKITFPSKRLRVTFRTSRSEISITAPRLLLMASNANPNVALDALEQKVLQQAADGLLLGHLGDHGIVRSALRRAGFIARASAPMGTAREWAAQLLELHEAI